MTDAELVTPAAPNVRWPAELARLFGLVEDTIAQAPDLTDRSAVARALCLAVADNLGGRMVYFPRGTYLKRVLRDRKLYSEFDGRNHRELAEHYDLCLQTVYKIIADQRAADPNGASAR
jgi:Mor family transcriptional regulator